MAANPNWTRWIMASVARYLKAVSTAKSLACLVEGVDDRTDEFMSAADRVEIRVTGPFSRAQGHNYYRLQVDVNVLLTSRYDGDQKNRYDIYTNAGLFHEAMDQSIPVRKHGSEPGDDGTQIGCLTPAQGRNDAVRVFHFGQTNDTDRLKQSAVDARYEMFLET